MLPQKPLKLKISITIDEPLIEKIRYLAEQDDRSVSQYINIVIRQHLDQLQMNNDKHI